MSIDRRAVLRAAAGSAAVGAFGAGCADEAPPTTPATTPATADSRPGHATSPPGAPPAALPDQITHGPRDRSEVALTFHGQGDPDLAEELLREAERAGAHITVLAVGRWLQAHPRMAERVLAGGHELGNHTHNHLDICALSADEAAGEITRCADTLRRLTGGQGRWFRPSQARYATPLVRQLAEKAGYPHVLSYDVDPLDYTDPGADAVRDAVLGAVRGGSVVSLHLGHQDTVTALPAVLDGLRQRGLRAVTAGRLLLS